MAGIYIHIPFCRQACHYCNFHFSTSLKGKSDIVKAITKEIDHRHNYLNTAKLDTIYFGGGTPSILSGVELEYILSALKKYYKYDLTAEITLEANPEDLTIEYLKQLKAIGINRLSIGVQSFFDEDLSFMNRSHDAKQAKVSIENALQLFQDISIDLIFSGQYSSVSNWNANLETALAFNAPHISSYSLTIEEGTVFGNWMEKNKIQPIEDDKQKDQFLQTIETLTQAGYEHYEISNYAKPKKYAKHNTNYWKNKPYLGLGPSAHSYNGESRQWNVSNNHNYLKSVLENKDYSTTEYLSEKDNYNEYILTSLRTMWGCDIKKISLYANQYQSHFETVKEKIIAKNLVVQNDNILSLTTEGKLFADQVAEELFFLN